MINLKALALTATIAASAFVSAPAAQAKVSCGQIADAGRWCGEWVGEYRGGSVYDITYTHFDGREEMTVICGNYGNVIDWNSTGTLTQGQANWVAKEFCALPE